MGSTLRCELSHLIIAKIAVGVPKPLESSEIIFVYIHHVQMTAAGRVSGPPLSYAYIRLCCHVTMKPKLKMYSLHSEALQYSFGFSTLVLLIGATTQNVCYLCERMLL